MQNQNLLNKKYILIIILTFVFGVLGTTYIYDLIQGDNYDPPNIEVSENKEVSYKGRIQYIDPTIYQEDKITHVLLDGSNKEIILLKADDYKLSVAEGLFATLYGTLEKTAGGEDFLLVNEIVISSSE